ncbi:MAG TPA: S1/P1 nuclease [Pyrinomonadaceae bacterium]|jgi:hypothetical protein|nr:S1/P1 nuclease [Pyrinomonadaceae bacterium]
MKRLLLACALVLAVTQQALPYGRQGHQAVAQAAQAPDMLNQRARTAIRNLLGNQRLADVALWADDLKGAREGEGPLARDAEARKFNQRFPDNADWHFVNLPLASGVYTPGGPFSKPRDIVNIINECIAILETPPNRPTRFTKRQALRLLVHFVGDIHQPLHVVSGYYDFDAQNNAILIRDPTLARNKPHDLGGNQLVFGGQKMHGFWDTRMVERVANGNRDFNRLAIILLARLRDPVWMNAHRAGFVNSGDHHAWAAAWATDSLAQANQAYAGLVFGRTTFRVINGKRRIEQIDTTLPNNYADNQLDRATTQLVKATSHLAALLNAIDWQ